MQRRKTILAIFLVFLMILTACGSNGVKDKKVEGKSQEVVVKGHNGDVKLNVKFDGDKISDIEIKEHKETDPLGVNGLNKVKDAILKNQSINVDTVTGATVSSTAMLEGVKEAIKKAGLDESKFSKKSEESSKNEQKELNTDVVVIGGGGAGFAAAITAKEKGANVILLEKLASVGGNTLISGGEYAAPESDLQKKEKIEDSKEQFAKDIEVAGGNKDLIKVLSQGALDGAKWLKDNVKVEWIDQLMFFGGHSVKRSLVPKGHSGSAIIKKYVEKVKEVGVEVLTEHDVKEIITDNGKIVGVRAKTPQGETIVKAKSVVVASGGFGANDEMTFKYDKEIDDKILSTNSKGSTGDGIVMSENLAQIQLVWNISNFIQFVMLKLVSFFM